MFLNISIIDTVFTPRPFGPKGYCRCLRLSVCPSVRLSVRKIWLVRAITQKIFLDFFILGSGALSCHISCRSWIILGVWKCGHLLICVVFTPRPIRPEGYCRHPCPSVRPSIRMSVCMLPEACLHDNSKGISYKFIKLAHKMYLGKLKFPIVFERSRSKVKVTRGQKVKNFDRPYLKNYSADSLQTKTKMYS